MKAQPWDEAFLQSQAHVGDNEADAAIAALGDDAGGIAAASSLLRTLRRNNAAAPDGLPASLRAYLDQTRQLPEWADPERIRRGEELFRRWGMQIALCLACSSLGEGYMHWRLAHVVHLTGRMESGLKRRLIETFQFVMDVMAPGGLEPGGRAIVTAQRVRLMHAAIRRLVRERAAQPGGEQIWQDDWGVPICQEDLATVLVSYTALVADSMRKLQVDWSDEEEDAFLHRWNVVGHFMGIENGLLANSMDDARALMARARTRYYRATPAGIALEAALIEVLDNWALPGQRGQFPEMIRFLGGEKWANALKVPRVSRAQAALFEVDRTLKGLLRRVSNDIDLEVLIAPLNQAIIQGFLRHELDGGDAPFDIPTELRAAWRIDD